MPDVQEKMTFEQWYTINRALIREEYIVYNGLFLDFVNELYLQYTRSQNLC